VQSIIIIIISFPEYLVCVYLSYTEDAALLLCSARSYFGHTWSSYV